MILAIAPVYYLGILIFALVPEKLPYVYMDLLCVFIPAAGYFGQLFNMMFSRSSKKFKMNSSIVLMLSNYMKIVYYFDEKFDYYLLGQSIATCVIHSLLCFLYYNYLPKKDPENSEELTISQKIKNFLQCDTYIKFFVANVIVAIAILACYYGACTFLSVNLVCQFTGVVANLIDSLQTFPPFRTIVFHKDIQYTTDLLVIQWILATLFKAGLFTIRPVPWPFYMGLGIQAFLCLGITIQYYRIRFHFTKSGFISQKDVNEEQARAFEEEEDGNELEAFDDNSINDQEESTV